MATIASNMTPIKDMGAETPSTIGETPAAPVKYYVESKKHKVAILRERYDPGTDLFKPGDAVEVIFQQDEWYVGRHLVKETEHVFPAVQCDIVMPGDDAEIIEHDPRKKEELREATLPPWMYREKINAAKQRLQSRHQLPGAHDPAAAMHAAHQQYYAHAAHMAAEAAATQHHYPQHEDYFPVGGEEWPQDSAGLGSGFSTANFAYSSPADWHYHAQEGYQRQSTQESDDAVAAVAAASKRRPTLQKQQSFGGMSSPADWYYTPADQPHVPAPGLTNDSDDGLHMTQLSRQTTAPHPAAAFSPAEIMKAEVDAEVDAEISRTKAKIADQMKRLERLQRYGDKKDDKDALYNSNSSGGIMGAEVHDPLGEPSSLNDFLRRQRTSENFPVGVYAPGMAERVTARQEAAQKAAQAAAQMQAFHEKAAADAHMKNQAVAHIKALELLNQAQASIAAPPQAAAYRPPQVRYEEVAAIKGKEAAAYKGKGKEYLAGYEQKGAVAAKHHDRSRGKAGSGWTTPSNNSWGSHDKDNHHDEAVLSKGWRAKGHGKGSYPEKHKGHTKMVLGHRPPVIPINLEDGLTWEGRIENFRKEMTKRTNEFGVPFVAQDESQKYAASARKYLCTFVVQIPDDKVFYVAKRIIGPGGRHMMNIWSIVPSAKVRLRGRGSGFKEHDTGMEADEDLRLNVSVQSKEGFVMVKHLVASLLKRVYQEYQKITGKKKQIKLLEHPANPRLQEDQEVQDFMQKHPFFQLANAYQYNSVKDLDKPAAEGHDRYEPMLIRNRQGVRKGEEGNTENDTSKTTSTNNTTVSDNVEGMVESTSVKIEELEDVPPPPSAPVSSEGEAAE